jgi:hypothetical protein
MQHAVHSAHAVCVDSPDPRLQVQMLEGWRRGEARRRAPAGDALCLGAGKAFTECSGSSAFGRSIVSCMLV